MQVEVTKAYIGWQLPPLLSRTVHFGQVNMEQLRIQSTPGPKDETPTEPLQSLELPVRIDLPVHIEQLIWEGPPQIEIHALDALYRYTGKEHQLDVRSLRYADGSYEAQLRLQGAAPCSCKPLCKAICRPACPAMPNRPSRYKPRPRCRAHWLPRLRACRSRRRLTPPQRQLQKTSLQQMRHRQPPRQTSVPPLPLEHPGTGAGRCHAAAHQHRLVPVRWAAD